MMELQFNMLDSITNCLDKEHDGYRYEKESEDFKKILERLSIYNIMYCGAISRFNPEMSPNYGDHDKVVNVLALMRVMEERALTDPDGFNPSNNDSWARMEDADIFPNQDEIAKINANAPYAVTEILLLTKVEYDEKTKVQTFFYHYTQEIDEREITPKAINRFKANMVSELNNDKGNRARLSAGVIFLYKYYSVDNRKLYEIRVDSSDF